jgi:hypothetical protein
MPHQVDSHSATSASNLAVHVRRRTAEKPYKCTKSKCTFATCSASTQRHATACMK